MPKVSIVLPTYNGEKYICESIESIINQTYTDWELIIVDDCSNDNTPAIIEKYAEQDLRIKVIHNSINQKLPKSLNIGFEYSIGDFLTWTSDDNIFYETALETMKNYIDDSNTYMVKANYDIIDYNGKFIRTVVCSDKTLSAENNVGACFMYKRDVYQKIGDYDLDLFYVEDYDYWLRVEKFFGPISHLDCVLYAYRNHADSLTSSCSDNIAKQIQKLKIKHIDYILNNIDKNQMCKLLFELKHDHTAPQNILIKLMEYFPEFKHLHNSFNPYIPHYIFGAGMTGKNKLDKYKNMVYGFIDNDKKKIGTKYEGYPVFSVNDLKSINYDFQVLIAVSEEYIYEIIYQLENNKINNYVVI